MQGNDHASVHEEWVNVCGMRVHVLRAGAWDETGIGGMTEPPLLLLHGGGLGSAWLMYGDCLAALAAHVPVLALDWPGYGASDKPDVPYTMDWYIAFLAGFLDVLGVERAQLCGLSMGGGIALGFALAHPGRVARLILVNSYGLTGDTAFKVAATVVMHLPYTDTLSWWGLRRNPHLMRLALRGVLAHTETLPDTLITEACALVRDPGTVRAWRHWQRDEIGWWGLRTSYLSRLSAIEAPTLLIHGECDRLVPVAVAARATGHIPDARLCIVPDCGHWPMREHPAVFLDVVTTFLAKQVVIA